MPDNQIKVTYLNHMGDDLAVANAARVSYDKTSDWEVDLLGNKVSERDKKLIQYLTMGLTTSQYECLFEDLQNLFWAVEYDTNIIEGEWTTDLDFLNKDLDYYKKDLEWSKKEIKRLLWGFRKTPTHAAPFGHCFLSVRVAAPIFVARQLVKHEYLRMSEVSRRYVKSEPEFFSPDVFRQAPEKGQSKQGSSGECDEQDFIHQTIEADFGYCLSDYNLLQDVYGVCAEQARMVLPLNTMTEWVWSGSLDAFANMCCLRLNDDVQYETRLVAEQVYEVMKEHWPVSAPALVKGPVND